jgi:hypothetical protein
MKNLCHFTIVAGGVTFPPQVPSQLVFLPRLSVVSYRPSPLLFPVLLGFNASACLPATNPGERVIVPRFAAAVGWAREAGLDPYCVPLSGQRQPDGSFICDELEEAPDKLEVSFPGDDLQVNEIDETTLIFRAIGGQFTVEVLDGPDLPPVDESWTAYRYPDGSVHLPDITGVDDYGYPVAILVPQDGKIIEAVADAFPAAALLVTDVTRPGQRTRLLQVR